MVGKAKGRRMSSEDDFEEEHGGGKIWKKRGRKCDDDEDDDYMYEERGGKQQKRRGSQFFDEEAKVASDDESEESDAPEDGFIVDNVTDLPEEGQIHRPLPFNIFDDQEEDDEHLESMIRQRYMQRDNNIYSDDDDEEETEVGQQNLLPSIWDPKLWMVKCAIGREREAAVCLMQKCIERVEEMQIKSAVALDHLKGYIYIEAEKEVYVREACKGMRNLNVSKILMVPIKEMTDVLSVKSEAVEICVDACVRLKKGFYKGDLAKVVDVDPLRRKVTLKLIPRIDLISLADKLEGNEVKKKGITPRPRLMNIDEARGMNIPVHRKFDPVTRCYFDIIGGMMFKDGFLYKKLSMKSISTHNIQPTLDEVEQFKDSNEDITSLLSLCKHRKKGHFMKGDRVITVKGDLKKLKGIVEKVDKDNVYINLKEHGILDTVVVDENEISKYFEPGNHVKVLSGVSKGATGMVASVEGVMVNIVSDATKELLRVFADCIVSTSEVAASSSLIGGSQQANTDRKSCSFQSRHGGNLQRLGLAKGSSMAKIKICKGNYKGCRGVVKEVRGNCIRVELEAQMNIVTVTRDEIAYDERDSSSSLRGPSRCGRDSETPIHPSQTPLRPLMTPMREYPGTPLHYGLSTPVHYGMRTPTHESMHSPTSSLGVLFSH